MIENREGQRIPEVTFRTRTDTDWRDVTSAELFDRRTVVVFALPGAFTPTCSATHLPRYEELAGDFAAAGVDEIVCVSVNDPFVMNAWGAAQGVHHVRMLPDGNGAFTAGLGMLVDKSDLGFGRRSWRYSMVVRDGVVEKMFVEPEVAGDPFTVSDADTMLAHLAPHAKPADGVAVFTRPGCPHCDRARALLTAHGYDYDEIRLGASVSNRALRSITGATTTPQVYIGGQHVGTADELDAWLAERSRDAA